VLATAAGGCEPAAPAYDLAPPRVLATTPVAGASGVEPAAPVEVVFDEPVGPLDQAHVVLAAEAAATAALRADLDAGGLGSRALGDVVASTVTSLDGGRRVRLEHPALDRGASYVLLVSAAVADAAGNSLAGTAGEPVGFEARFATAPAGATARLVVPDPAGGPVPPNLPEVAVAFDRALRSIPGDAVRVEDAAGRPVPGEAFLSADGLRIRRTVDERLRPGVRHAVILAPLVDADGTPVDGGPWGFDVAPCSDERPPRIADAAVEPRDFGATLRFHADEPGTAGARLRALDACGATPGATAATACDGALDPCDAAPAPDLCTATVTLDGLCPDTRYEVTPLFTDAAGHEASGAPVSFRTLPPSARPAIVEVLADAASPEETGEFVELVNDSAEPWDLAGWTLVKVTASAETARSLVRRDGATGPIPGRATAVYAVREFDAGRYGGLPAGAILLEAATATPERAVFGSGLSSSSPPRLELRGPGGVVLSTWPAGLRCSEGTSAARAPGASGDPSCGEPTPGAPAGA
jgi:hypothetical protein